MIMKEMHNGVHKAQISQHPVYSFHPEGYSNQQVETAVKTADCWWCDTVIWSDTSTIYKLGSMCTLTIFWNCWSEYVISGGMNIG